MIAHRAFSGAHRLRLVAICLAGVMSASSALAAKPEWAGPQGKGDKMEKPDRDRAEKSQRAQEPYRSSAQEHGARPRKEDKHGAAPGPARAPLPVGGYFQGHQRSVAQTYYHQQFSAGNCPPGLAKKHNGCMPPGQARKWAVGRPLPRDVVYYAVPPALVVQLGSPPSGYRYVRVATDILLIAIGTSMVIDAIDDLGRM